MFIYNSIGSQNWLHIAEKGGLDSLVQYMLFFFWNFMLKTQFTSHDVLGNKPESHCDWQVFQLVAHFAIEQRMSVEERFTIHVPRDTTRPKCSHCVQHYKKPVLPFL
jgi:hypothetical protein